MGVWWHALAFVTHERAKMSHKPGRNVTQAGPKCHTRAKMSHSHVIIYNNHTLLMKYFEDPFLTCKVRLSSIWKAYTFQIFRSRSAYILTVFIWKQVTPSKPETIKKSGLIIALWRHQMFLCYRPFVLGIHRSPVNSQHKGQWRGALIFSLIFTRANSWANNVDAGDLRRYCARYDVIVMVCM